jgi:hypothetical protein
VKREKERREPEREREREKEREERAEKKKILKTNHRLYIDAPCPRRTT